ncbi:hypothetical protein FQA39_LY16930 [Lamprigera yunnana]|nr:hypothetical protein FQA39_LY16930 [Lamprigera yunnana]
MAYAGNELDGQEVTGSNRGEEVDGGGSGDVSKTKRWMAAEEVDGARGVQDEKMDGGRSGYVPKAKRWMAAEEIFCSTMDCSKCGLHFSRADNRKRHELRCDKFPVDDFEDIISHTCASCGKVFSREDNKNRHKEHCMDRYNGNNRKRHEPSCNKFPIHDFER